MVLRASLPAPENPGEDQRSKHDRRSEHSPGKPCKAKMFGKDSNRSHDAEGKYAPQPEFPTPHGTPSL